MARILTYRDYRRYLGDVYESKKQQKYGFSFRQWALAAGFKSPNYLQLVIQGKRNLTSESAQAVAKSLKLSPEEAEFFYGLVRIEHAGSREDKVSSERQLRKAAQKLATGLIERHQIQVFDRWYILLVRELLLLTDFEPTGAYISRRLQHLITPTEAIEALDILEKAGFAEKVKGHWRVKDIAISSGHRRFLDSQLREVHRQVLGAWAKNLEKFHPHERETHLLNIPIRREKVPELMKRVREFQDELIGWLKDEENPDEIVQLGTYAFLYGEE